MVESVTRPVAECPGHNPVDFVLSTNSIRTDRWKDPRSADRYSHTAPSEEARRADLLPTPPLSPARRRKLAQSKKARLAVPLVLSAAATNQRRFGCALHQLLFQQLDVADPARQHTRIPDPLRIVRIHLDASHVGFRKHQRELGPGAGRRVETRELVDVM